MKMNDHTSYSRLTFHGCMRPMHSLLPSSQWTQEIFRLIFKYLPWFKYHSLHAKPPRQVVLGANYYAACLYASKCESFVAATSGTGSRSHIRVDPQVAIEIPVDAFISKASDVVVSVRRPNLPFRQSFHLNLQKRKLWFWTISTWIWQNKTCTLHYCIKYFYPYRKKTFHIPAKVRVIRWKWNRLKLTSRKNHPCQSNSLVHYGYFYSASCKQIVRYLLSFRL